MSSFATSLKHKLTDLDEQTAHATSFISQSGDTVQSKLIEFPLDKVQVKDATAKAKDLTKPS